MKLLPTSANYVIYEHLRPICPTLVQLSIRSARAWGASGFASVHSGTSQAQQKVSVQYTSTHLYMWTDSGAKNVTVKCHEINLIFKCLHDVGSVCLTIIYCRLSSGNLVVYLFLWKYSFWYSFYYVYKIIINWKLIELNNWHVKQILVKKLLFTKYKIIKKGNVLTTYCK